MSNCKYVKNAIVRKSSRAIPETEKCQSLEVRRAIDQLDICEKSQKLAWTTKLKNHRTASRLEERYIIYYIFYRYYIVSSGKKCTTCCLISYAKNKF